MSHSIVEELARLRAEVEDNDLTVGELLDVLGERGYALAVVLFCAVFLTPVPLPGLSTVFGAAVIALGVGLTLGIQPWLPTGWKSHRVTAKRVGDLITAAERIAHRAGGWARPRGAWALRPIFPRACGTGIVACGVILSLPLPPGGNFTPALGCVLFAVAILARDGLFAIYGALAMALSGGILAFILWGAWRALGMIGT